MRMILRKNEIYRLAAGIRISRAEGPGYAHGAEAHFIHEGAIFSNAALFHGYPCPDVDFVSCNR